MIFTEGGNGTATVIQADSSHPNIINVADAELLSCGAFHRTGSDLHLHGRDGQHVIIPGYFASEHPATLVAPSGERLAADALALLVGPATRDEYAQAQPAKISSDAPSHVAADAIGHVEKVVGNVTAVRDGVAVTLHVGDAVYKSDIIQTGSSSSIGICLSDGSAVNLVANTRMVLNAYSYGANSDSSAALFSLVEGTFAFVAGKVAHGGDMKIATPVATMSVRDGASGWAHQLTSSEIAAISSKLGNDSYSFAVFNDHGLRSHGIYDLVVDGAVVGSVDDPNLVCYLDRQGDLFSLPLNKSDLADDFLQWLRGNDAQPSTLQAIHGSGSPIDAPTFPQLVSLDLGIPSFDFNPGGGGTTFGVGFVPDLSFLPPGGPTPHSNVFGWNGTGSWDLDPFDWNQGFAPASPVDIVVIQTGKSSYDGGYTIGSLTVDFGATLNIVGGSLTVSSVANAGLVELNSSGVDPTLAIDGAVSLTGGGAIEMLGPATGNFIVGLAGTGATLTNVDNVISGSGDIGKGDGNLTFINDATVDATPLLAGDRGLLIVDTGHAVNNFGVFEATRAGELVIEDQLFNSSLVEAAGAGSAVVINNASPDIGGNLPANANVNIGIIEALDGGVVTIENSTIVNSSTDSQGRSSDGLIEAGAGSTLTVENGSTITGGVLKVGLDGTLNVDDSTLTDVAISDAWVVNFGPGDTLSPSDVLTFVGNSTVKVEGNTNLDLTLAGLTTGDVIDLGNTVVTSAVWNGSSLILNGVPVAFSVAGGLPAGDTFAFKPDGSGGTDLTILPQLVGVSSTPAAGTEGSPIPVSFSIGGAGTVTAFVISDIPLGATLSDGHGNSFTATAQLDSVDVHAWNMGSLTVTPPNDTNFALSATVTVTDGNGYSYSAVTTETVTVNPPPPSIATGTDATAVYETGTAAAVTLDNAVTVTDPDSNGNLAGATVTIVGGLLLGDTLAATTAGTTITASYDATKGVLTLSGTDTLAHYAQVLDSVTYASTATDPTEGGADMGRIVNWQVGDGRAPSNVAASTVNFVTGTATVAVGGTLEITTPSNQKVTFTGGTGELKLDDPAAFSGHIVGFSATTSDSDVIDLVGIDFTSPGFTESYDAATGRLALTDGVHSASLIFDYFSNLLNFTSDGHGGTLITNQPATIASGGSLEIGKLTVGTVTFAGTTGSLKLDNPGVFSGHIDGFSATASDSDLIDVSGIDFNALHFTESYDAATGQLSLTDGVHSASLTFDYFNNLLNFSSDGHGGTAITDQPATIASGGSLEIGKLTVGTVTFADTTGTLKLDNPGVFSGHIDGFSATTSNSDLIDVSGIDFNSLHFAENYDASTGQLSLTDGVHSASLTFDYFNNLLNFSSDGHGGTAITDQPATIASGGSLEIGKLTVGTITFADTTGSLKLDNPGVFSGHIDGFSATASASDLIDVSGIDFNALHFAETYNAATDQLSLTDGVHSASLTLDYFGNALNFASDGHGGTAITDQPTGPATVAAGERLDVWTLDSATITFTGGTGELKLDNPAGFSGHIAGFTGTAPDAADSDAIDLVGIDYNSAKFAETYDASSGLLSVTDGTHNASFTFDNFSATLHFASDNNGGTLITDPPAPAVAAAPPGGGENFEFIFHPGGGTEIAAHAERQHDGTAPDDPPAQSRSFMPSDVDRDWLTEPGHHDDMTSSPPQHLQAHLDSAIHLH